MHDESLIPVFRLIPGSKKNKYPVYVMSNGPGLLSGLHFLLPAVQSLIAYPFVLGLF